MILNQNTVDKHAGAYFCWEVPEEGVVVRFHLNLVDLLEQEAIVAGDRTAAGVLIGQTENGRQLTLTVESNEPIIPELGASRTPFGNRRQIAEIVDRWRPGRKRISIVGFYRTSTREDELLDKEDLAALGTGLSAADIGSSEPENSNREHPKGLDKQTEHPPSQAVTADTMDASLDESTYSSQAETFSLGSIYMQQEQIFILIRACP